MEIAWVSPPGPIANDLIVRSDPRSASDAPAHSELPEGDEDPYHFDELDPNDDEALDPRNELKDQMNCLNIALHPLWDVIPRVGHYERINTFRNLLSGMFYTSDHTIIIYHHLHESARIQADLENRLSGLPETAKRFRKGSPRGMPLTAWQVDRLIKLLHNSYAHYRDRILAFVFLREFYYIARSVTPAVRDPPMDHIMAQGVFNPNYFPDHIHASELLPPWPDLGRATGIANPSADHMLNIDEVARYAVLYGQPGVNHFTSIVMDYAFRVDQ
jgi:hypothetical protein